MTPISLRFATIGAAILTLGALAPVFAEEEARKTETASFTATAVEIDDLIGTLVVEIGAGPQIAYSVEGREADIKLIKARVEGGHLVIEQTGTGGNSLITLEFDWGDGETKREGVKVHLTVPEGTPFNIDGLIGEAKFGDLKGPLSIEMAATDLTAGELSEAHVSGAGAGDIDIARVTGAFVLDLAGGGDVRVGDVASATIDIAGAGDVTLGVIGGDFEIDIAGSGDIKAASVNGKVDIDIAGAGDIDIKEGTATSFSVDIAGSGDVKFGGTANNPRVSTFGSGDVWIRAYTGQLNSENGSLRVGDGD